MKTILRLIVLVMLFAPAALGHAQTATGNLYIHLKDGGLDVIPDSLVKSRAETGGELRITLRTDSVIAYSLSAIASIESEAPSALPRFTSYKFNNKYNDQLPADVIATIGESDTIRVEVGAIGKRLTASFQLDQADAFAFVNGAQQESKVSRLRFDKDIVYTLGRPGQRIFTFRKVQDEVWTQPGDNQKEERINLTAEMLTTNAPSNYPESEDLSMVLDGNPQTFFHSTWGTGDYEKLPLNEYPYIEIRLPEALTQLKFTYITRPDAQRYPQELVVQVSTDGVNWTDVTTLEDGLPTSTGASYTSPVIDLGGTYDLIRLVQTKASYKNYLCMAELAVYKVTTLAGSEPTLVSPAKYAYEWQPYGRNVVVSVDWLTDHATNVPRIDINIEGGILPPDKVTYLKADITIDGGGVFPNMTDSVQIRGRGNSSWAGQSGKSPYRLKFAVKKKPFGLKAGKSWVLLANRQTGSMMTNPVAMKVARLVGAAAANDMIPVELYMNGEYRGSYVFTQQVGLSNNSVDLEDDTNATLLELDSYYDEAYKFHDHYYTLPVNVKDPDFEEAPDPERFQLIQDDFNALTSLIRLGVKGAFDDKLDPEMAARFLFVNQYVHNCELMHPKSCYLYREDVRALHCPYILGPVWDFDWAYGYDGSYKYCLYKTTNDMFTSIQNGTGGRFYNAIFNNSDAVQRANYRIWRDFMEKYQEEMLEFVDDYFAYARPSFEHNSTMWGDGAAYDVEVANMKSWLDTRANYLYAQQKVFDLDTPVAITQGDVNLDGAITAADAVCVMNEVMGLENESFDSDQADVDRDKRITVSDAVHIVAMALRQPALLPRHLSLPTAEASLRMEDFRLTAASTNSVPVHLTLAEAAYSALQFDVVLPDGLALTDVELPNVWKGCQTQISEPDEQGRVRVIVLGNAGETFPAGTATLHLNVWTDRLIPSAQRILTIDQSLLVNKLGEDNRLATRSAAFEMESTTGITAPQTSCVRGGNGSLVFERLNAGNAEVYTIDGRLVRRLQLPAGTSRIQLPAGVYIVDGQKVIVE